jgi:hypothetical protein
MRAADRNQARRPSVVGHFPVIPILGRNPAQEPENLDYLFDRKQKNYVCVRCQAPFVNVCRAPTHG